MIRTFICMNEDCLYLRIHERRWEYKTLAAQDVKMCQKCRKKMKVKGEPK